MRSKFHLTTAGVEIGAVMEFDTPLEGEDIGERIGVSHAVASSGTMRNSGSRPDESVIDGKIHSDDPWRRWTYADPRWSDRQSDRL